MEHSCAAWPSLWIIMPSQDAQQKTRSLLQFVDGDREKRL